MADLQERYDSLLNCVRFARTAMLKVAESENLDSLNKTNLRMWAENLKGHLPEAIEEWLGK